MSYFDTIMAAAPVAYWRMADAAEPFTDEIGSNDLGILNESGVTHQQPSILPLGEGLSALENFATNLVNATLLSGSENSFSIEFWQEYDLNFSTFNRPLFAYKTGSSGGNDAIKISIGAQTDPRLFLERLGEPTLATPVDSVPTDQGNHVVAVIDAPNRYLYINGVEIATDANAITYGASTPDYVFVLCAGVNDTCEQYGQEFAIYSRVLTPAEVLAHYEAGAGQGPAPTPEPPPFVEHIRYRATLTGAPDGETDLVLPISNAQATLRTSGEDYLTITVPAGAQYATGIYDRQNGEIVLDHLATSSDGAVVVSELARVNLQDIREDTGARSESVTLTGYKSVNYSDTSTKQVDDITYRSVSNGTVRWRSGVDPALKPGMTADNGAESFLIDTIAIALGRTQSVLELQSPSL